MARHPQVSLGAVPQWTAEDRQGVLDTIRRAMTLADQAWERSGQKSDGRVDPLTLVEADDCKVRVARINSEDMSPTDRGWVSGALRRRPTDTVTQIVLESKDTLGRRRFSLGHEYAHICLYRQRHGTAPEATLAEVRRPNDRDPDDAVYCREKPDEYFADMFSHMFLMPSVVIRGMRRAGLTVDEMATKLKVTLTTMERRLLYLELEAEALGVT
ncbi:MAG: ImmA/IrrE family metallo-endopeptidase [Bifidobacteriaceae bacterium]|jgi:hypothetical protein|nr:ImmA/IrrE family metallo-endopeptidase [Bifidobacteriaceae bacterium]